MGRRVTSAGLFRRLTLAYLGALVFFGWGFFAASDKVFPGRFLTGVKAEIERFIAGDAEGARQDLDTAILTHTSSVPLKHLKRRDLKAERHLAGVAVNGAFPPSVQGACLKVVTSHEGARAVLLLGDRGRVLQHWDVDYDRVFGTEGLDKDGDVNGSLLLADGSVIVNYAPYAGLARVGHDGRVIWKFDQPQTHHSVTLTPRNTIWVPGRERLSETRLGQPAGRQEDLLLEIAVDDGRILRKIYTVDLLAKSQLHGLYEMIISRDKLHVNDVEEIGPAFARRNARLGFAATDIIVNAKRMNLIFVADPVTLVVKWHQHSPWNQPHDIDLHDSGEFTLFDNNQAKGKPARRWGTSRILSVNPATRKVTTLFQEEWFHSDTRSDYQYHGDNLLVTSDNQALLFNVFQGRVNFWYTKPHDKKNWFVEDAEWVDAGFFSNDRLAQACRGG